MPNHAEISVALSRLLRDRYLAPEHLTTMSTTLKTIESSLVNLEDIQTKVGAIQVGLLRILTDDVHDEWDDAAQQALLKLEAVQRHIGQVQISLVRKTRPRWRNDSASRVEVSMCAPPARTPWFSWLVRLQVTPKRSPC